MALSHFGSQHFGSQHFASNHFRGTVGPITDPEIKSGGGSTNPFMQWRHIESQTDVLVEKNIGVDEQDFMDIITIIVASGVLDE